MAEFSSNVTPYQKVPKGKKGIKVSFLLLFCMEGHPKKPTRSYAGCGGIKPASNIVNKTVRPATHRGARCKGHPEITLSAV